LDLARPTVHGQPYGHAGIPPCLVALYQDEAPEIVVLKSAQVGVSEYLISMALWAVDTQAGDRGVGLYVFPAIAQVSDFVRARVDPAIEESAYLAARVRPVKGVLTSSSKFADNVGLKRVGKGYLYFRGSNASAGLKSVDADIVVYDEVDELRPGTEDIPTPPGLPGYRVSPSIPPTSPTSPPAARTSTFRQVQPSSTWARIPPVKAHR